MASRAAQICWRPPTPSWPSRLVSTVFRHSSDVVEGGNAVVVDPFVDSEGVGASISPSVSGETDDPSICGSASKPLLDTLHNSTSGR